MKKVVSSYRILGVLGIVFAAFHIILFVTTQGPSTENAELEGFQEYAVPISWMISVITSIIISIQLAGGKTIARGTRLWFWAVLTFMVVAFAKSIHFGWEDIPRNIYQVLAYLSVFGLYCPPLYGTIAQPLKKKGDSRTVLHSKP